ncbi:Multidrug resistance-associated protein [Blattamonas nauphoetae]|uniref:Multidrug resistance-associated protein n=1 Tax=Blattamonas nauphoetae TaxID=2049346 RepID=A0ABQ9WYI0_9EUKA|nr:Multidrug resistance-associated protein [Blattamonas nauphoetae]
MPLDVVIRFLLYDMAAEAVSLVSTCWLGKNSKPTAIGGMGSWWKIGVNGFLALGLLVLLMLRSAMTAGAVGRSARVDYDKLMDHVMSCLSSFFDTTPMCRILNRFTGDIPQVDQFLFPRFLSVLSMWVGLTTIQSYEREDEWKEKFFEVNDDMPVPSMLYSGMMLLVWFFMDVSKLSVAMMLRITLSNLGVQVIQQRVDLESTMTSKHQRTKWKWASFDITEVEMIGVFRLVELDPKLAPKMIDMKTGFPVDTDPNEEPNSGRPDFGSGGND